MRWLRVATAQAYQSFYSWTTQSRLDIHTRLCGKIAEGRHAPFKFHFPGHRDSLDIRE
jgi:hypothetical protein